MRSAADMPDVGWPEPAFAAGRIESTLSCCPSSRQSSTSFVATTSPFTGCRNLKPILGTVRSVKVAVAFDHRGVHLRDTILETLREDGHEIVDLGTDTDAVRIDYTDKAVEIAAAVKDGEAERGVLVCGSGVGAAVAASKIAGIRAAICHDVYSAHQGVEHDDMNVLCLGSEVVGPSLTADLVRTFLAARFDGEERHAARLEKIRRIEEGMLNG